MKDDLRNRQKVVTHILFFFLTEVQWRTSFAKERGVAYQSTIPISLNIARQKNRLLAGTLLTKWDLKNNKTWILKQLENSPACIGFYDCWRKTSHKEHVAPRDWWTKVLTNTGLSHEKDICKKSENRGMKRDGGRERQYDRHLHAIRQHAHFFFSWFFLRFGRAGTIRDRARVLKGKREETRPYGRRSGHVRTRQSCPRNFKWLQLLVGTGLRTAKP